MYKFLVVGCGGSGGETLARMMDQLTSELLPHGITELPAGWQFVHVDVPVVPDTNIKGVGNVHEQGGRYIGTAPSSGSYAVLDNAVSQKLSASGDLADFVTWAPRNPERITTPLANGAGQMRAVGRVITLNRAGDVFEGLQQAVNKLNTTEANAEMSRVANAVPGAGRFEPEAAPMVFVVSSMAGGAGASMALDVCRLLGQVKGISTNDTAVYMYTSDIFPDRLEGVRPNALGMLGEIVSAQAVASEDHDLRILEALGQHVDKSGQPSFARVFPVSKYQGLERTTFGDGTQSGLYRGLARGLAALMISGAASTSFRAFDLTNREDLPPNRAYLGWGVDEAQKLSWGTFGFGSLSMGRDRYRHYASQRLAATAVDRLREGHLQAGRSAGSAEQLRGLVESQWGHFLTRLGLPDDGQTADLGATGSWLAGAIGQGQADDWARGVLAGSALTSELPAATGQSGENWRATVGNYLRQKQQALTAGINASVYRWAFHWSKDFESRLRTAVTEAISQFGLPYTRALLTRLENFLAGQVAPRMVELSRTAGPDLGRVPQGISEQLSATKGTIVAGDALEQNLVDSLHGDIVQTSYIQASGYLAQLLADAPGDVVAPLQQVVENSIQALDLVVDEPSRKVGLANVETDVYNAWPTDQDQVVPERFATAHNEVLLTPAEQFGDLYQAHLPASIPGQPGPVNWDNARTLAAFHVISGSWPVADGTQSPGGLLEPQAEWTSSVFKQHPDNGAPLTPSVARYNMHVSPRELRNRALFYVNRRNEAFDQYCALSLEDYVLGHDGAPPHEVAQRKTDLVAKFRQTLTRGLPLGSVHPDVVAQIHSASVRYRYTFSASPFGAVPDLVDELTAQLTGQTSVDAQTAEIFERSVVQGQDAAGITHVDMFGSFGNLSPLAFDGILSPVATRWSQLTSGGQRRDFWTFRRARPLVASLPMSDQERRAMVAGWYVAQITGQLQIPDRRNLNQPVQVYDRGTGQWLGFPNPLLTPPEAFVGESFDWLPAVLESVLLAIANAHQTPVLSSLRPYQVLRSIYDSADEGPASGLQILAAQDQLTEWLRTGQTPSGKTSRVHAETIDERYANTGKFLETIHNFAAGKLETSSLGGPRVTVASRRDGGENTPFFCDLVPDIVTVTERLLNTLETALTEAKQERSGSFAAGLPDDFGAF